MAGIQYRQLAAPAQVDTFAPDFRTGGEQAAAQLAQTFRDFSDTAFSVADKIQADRGQKAGAAAGATGAPDFKTGFAQYSAYDQAYNNAATRSYAIRSEADAEDTAARLQVQANNDPDTFRQTLTAARDATVAAAPAPARPILMDIYNRRLASGVAQLSAARAQEFRQQARSDLSEGVSRQVDKIAALRAAGDPASQQQADVEQAKLGMMIDGAHNDGTVTDVEAPSIHQDAQRQITAQTVVKTFQNTLDDPHGDPVGFIERFEHQNSTDDTLSPDEHQKLVQQMFSTLAEHNRLAALQTQQQKLDEEARYNVGDQSATGDLLAGTLTRGKLLDMVRTQQLKPETARTLLGELQNGDPPKDDEHVLFDYKVNLLHYTDQDIATAQGLTWKTRAALIDQRDKEAAGWKGTQAAKEAEQRIDRALGIVPGTIIQMLPDSVKTQRNRALTQWYDSVDALPPEERQSQVIPLAEDTIKKTIRQSSLDQVQEKISDKQRYTQLAIQQNGPMSSWSKGQKEEYNKQIATFDSDISQLQQEAARK